MMNPIFSSVRVINSFDEPHSCENIQQTQLRIYPVPVDRYICTIYCNVLRHNKAAYFYNETDTVSRPTSVLIQQITSVRSHFIFFISIFMRAIKKRKLELQSNENSYERAKIQFLAIFENGLKDIIYSGKKNKTNRSLRNVNKFCHQIQMTLLDVSNFSIGGNK